MMANQKSRFAPEKRRGENAHGSCPVCGAEKVEESFKSVERGFAVARCTVCGLGRTTPFISQEEVGAFYPDAYYGKENVRFNALFEHLTRLFRRRRASVIQRTVSPGPVLDVGCGRGFILNYLKSLGFEAHGVEFSDTAAWHARNVLGLEVETGDFLKSPHQKDRYNAVIFWHSLEHLPRPVEAIKRARELLKDGGTLSIAVPNFDSLQARFFGRYWFHLDIPRHYTHFSTKSIESLLIRYHFKIVQTDHFSFEQNPYGWIQSSFNAMGFDNHFLYALLKNKSARTINIRRHPLQTLLTLLLLPAVTFFALLMTVVEAALRRGGTIEIYASKQ